MRYSTQLKDYQINNADCASAGGRKMPYLRSAGWQGTVITTGFLLFRLPGQNKAYHTTKPAGSDPAGSSKKSDRSKSKPMTKNIQILQYDGRNIGFDLSADSIMINATEMAGIFGKRTENYLRSDRAKDIVQACLSYAKSRNSESVPSFAGVRSEADLVKVNHRRGTWLHRIVALDFAAWLDARFAVWMYLTVDQLLLAPVAGQAEKAKLFTRRSAAEQKKLLEDIETDEAGTGQTEAGKTAAGDKPYGQGNPGPAE